jgi:hypothetical protein
LPAQRLDAEPPAAHAQQVGRAVLGALHVEDLGERADGLDVRRGAGADLRRHRLGARAQRDHAEAGTARRRGEVVEQLPVALLEDVQRQRHPRQQHVAEREQRDELGHPGNAMRSRPDSAAPRSVNWQPCYDASICAVGPPTCSGYCPAPRSTCMPRSKR